MRPPEEDTVRETPAAEGPWPVDPAIAAHESRNLLLLAIHQIVFRVGWIFKTESVIMPAFLDAVAGPQAGWLRGFMPVVNRFAQSVPPVFLADRLKRLRHKHWALSLFTAAMGLPIAVLAVFWLFAAGRQGGWMPWLFLAVYGVFFVIAGMYHLASGTVQGKLIQPTRRGQLLMTATAVGTLPAMGAAWLLLPGWLERPDGGYTQIFTMTAACFIASGLLVLLIYETPDKAVFAAPMRYRGSLVEMLQVLRTDRNLRRLIYTAVLWSSCLIVFPHYQAFAREELGLSGSHLMVWVVTQNAAVGLYSLFVGPTADAFGNRLTLRWLIFGSAVAPLFVSLLPHLPGSMGARVFWTAFIALGITPLVLRILVNYALEICGPESHPRYLSTMSLCLAVPFLLSPLVGWLVDLVGFQRVFLSAAGLIVLAGLMTFRLAEPRHHLPFSDPAALEAGGDE